VGQPLAWRRPANPPGPEGSKGTEAPTGTRGVLSCLKSEAISRVTASWEARRQQISLDLWMC